METGTRVKILETDCPSHYLAFNTTAVVRPSDDGSRILVKGIASGGGRWNAGSEIFQYVWREEIEILDQYRLDWRIT